ncbi:Ndj1p [Kluyveromyces lactis]|uniref:KLLA0C12287p n=1 Tax=Kluyveromyces lactis (strain ATCC 8585 / CBS 2359 / DSM 70799 / NBRC 1267 / NRRL Y-1140 / WM37) TaxID=284590 RepID=Q6CTJ4_KLULA|nr:uncharacterized protein KLLA0_C12287g [Kluyveromyces lactis]CAH01596.1 KLLA0C12287p [Kluyveromyces lactis]|eukprot:XP_452745.1 uncharacterized protein KLLA0_C12287g [Kluyveromyces lactis]
MSELDEFYDCSNNEETVCYVNLSLFKGSHLIADNFDPERILPPSSFIKTLRTRLARESRNYSLLVWLLNCPNITLTQRSEHQKEPFQVFEPRQNRLYQHYLNIRPFSYADENISMDATLVSSESHWPDHYSYECSIFPRLLQKTNYDHFQMNRLCEEYRQQFIKIMENFEAQKPRHPKYAQIYLQQNLGLLTRAYIRDLFYDITFKYSAWSNAKRLTRVELLRSLQRYHKEYTFIMSCDPIDNFTEKLDHLTCLNYASKDEVNAKLTYGIWINAEHGLILLCNGIAHSWDLLQIPSHSYQNDDNITLFVTKYMLFCNMSVLETCLWFF